MPRGAGSRAFTVRAEPPTTAAHGRHSPLPSRAGGVNGFLSVLQGKERGASSPKIPERKPTPWSLQQGVDQLPGSKEQPRLQERRGRAGALRYRFPSRQAQVSVPASPKASLHNITSMEGKKLSRRPGLQVHPMGWKGSKVQKRPVSKQELSFSCQAVFKQFQLSNHRGKQRLVLPGETHTCCCPSGEKTAPKILSLNELPHSLPLSGQDEH